MLQSAHSALHHPKYGYIGLCIYTRVCYALPYSVTSTAFYTLSGGPSLRGLGEGEGRAHGQSKVSFQDSGAKRPA